MGSQRIRHFSALSAFLYFLFSCLQTYMNPIPTWKRTLIWTCSLFWPRSCFFPSFHSQNDNGTILTAFSFSVFMSLLNLCWVFNLFHCSAAFNTGDHPFVCRTNGSWKGSYRKKESEVAQSCPTLCDPMDCKPTRLLCPWDFPGKGAGVGCYFLLQGIFPTQELNLGFMHCRQVLYPLSHQGKYKCKIIVIIIIIEMLVFILWPRHVLNSMETYTKIQKIGF